MLLGKFVDQLSGRVKIQDPTNTTLRQTLMDKINESMKEIGLAFDWAFLKDVNDLITTPNYTTGSAAWVNGSRTITGSGGATWTASFKGRYLNVGSSNWYRISDVPAPNTLTLEQPVQESTSNGAYRIWKRFYSLPSDVHKILQFYKWTDGSPIEERSNRAYDSHGYDVSVTGVPQVMSLFGTDNYQSPYTTGTVSITGQTNILTGIGTAWLGNIGAGDIVILTPTQDRGVIEFRVRRVISDTSIILWQYATSDLVSQGYIIRPDATVSVEFRPQSDTAYVIPYQFVRRVFNMVNENNDRPPFPEIFDQCILDGAEAQMLRDLNDQKWTTKWQEYSSRLDNLKARAGRLSRPRFRQFAPFIPSRRSYGSSSAPGINGPFERG